MLLQVQVHCQPRLVVHRCCHQLVKVLAVADAVVRDVQALVPPVVGAGDADGVVVRGHNHVEGVGADPGLRVHLPAVKGAVGNQRLELVHQLLPLALRNARHLVNVDQHPPFEHLGVAADDLHVRRRQHRVGPEHVLRQEINHNRLAGLLQRLEVERALDLPAPSARQPVERVVKLQPVARAPHRLDVRQHHLHRRLRGCRAIVELLAVVLRVLQLPHQVDNLLVVVHGRQVEVEHNLVPHEEVLDEPLPAVKLGHLAVAEVRHLEPFRQVGGQVELLVEQRELLLGLGRVGVHKKDAKVGVEKVFLNVFLALQRVLFGVAQQRVQMFNRKIVHIIIRIDFH